MSYYSEVGHYYDKDAVDFERRYHLNPALQRIRQSFRERVKSHPQSTVLEVGFGPGFDFGHGSCGDVVRFRGRESSSFVI